MVKRVSAGLRAGRPVAGRLILPRGAGSRPVSALLRAMSLACSLAIAMACATAPPSPTATDRVAQPVQTADYDVLVGEFAARDQDWLAARNAFMRAVQKDPNSAFLQLRVASLSARLGEIELAKSHAARAVALEQENEVARILLARLRRHSGDVLGVEQVLRGDDGAPVSLRAGVLLVQLMIENERQAEALGTAEALVESYPDELGPYFALASVWEEAGDRAQVEATVLRAISAFPGEAALYSRLAQLRRAVGDVDGEIAAYQLLLEEQPDHQGTLRVLAQLMVEQGDLDAAVRFYEQAFEYYPDEMSLLQALTGLDLQRDEGARAVARLAEVLERRPFDYRMVYLLAVIRLDLGEADAAIADLARIPASHAAHRDARIRMVQLYEAREDVPAALAVMEELRLQYPDRRLDFHTAGLRSRSGDVEGGVALLQSYLAADAADAEATYQLALIYDAAQRREEAVEWMSAALAFDPNNAQALNYIGYTLAERGEDLERAEAMILRALELEPNDGYITDSLGWVYYMRAVPLIEAGQDQDASEWLGLALATLTRAAELSGGDPVISEHLGDVSLLAGRKREALAFYEEAFALEPRPAEQPDLFEKLEALRAELGSR